MTLVWILLGLVGLWVGSEVALRATIEVGERRGISPAFLGVTVLAIGTDLPEVLVAITGAVHQLGGVQASGVVVGNAVGSALAQGSLVLGLAGVFGRLQLAPEGLRRHGTALILSGLLLTLLAVGGGVTRLEGGVLLVAYAIYAWIVRADEQRRSRPDPAPWRRLRRQLVGIAVGLLIVLVCADLVVSNALQLAASSGWDQTVIGLFLVGAGTSLPELALSLGAVMKGRTGLAVGNIVGSNVFDLLVPTGLSAALCPLGVHRLTMLVDLPVLAVMTVLTLLFFVEGGRLRRWQALVLVLVYVVYALTRIVLLAGDEGPG